MATAELTPGPNDSYVRIEHVGSSLRNVVAVRDSMLYQDLLLSQLLAQQE